MKLVRESIENLRFERTKDPLRNLGVGIKAKWRHWCEDNGIKDYEINDDLTLTINGGGDMDLESLTSLPEGMQFNNGGYVDLSSLTSLPEEILFKKREDRQKRYVYLKGNEKIKVA